MPLSIHSKKKMSRIFVEDFCRFCAVSVYIRDSDCENEKRKREKKDERNALAQTAVIMMI